MACVKEQSVDKKTRKEKRRSSQRRAKEKLEVGPSKRIQGRKERKGEERNTTKEKRHRSKWYI